MSPTNKDEYENRVDNAIRKNVEINVDQLKNNEVSNIQALGSLGDAMTSILGISNG